VPGSVGAGVRPPPATRLYGSEMESFEFFAGRGGGRGVFNTKDEEELSQMAMEFPYAPFRRFRSIPP